MTMNSQILMFCAVLVEEIDVANVPRSVTQSNFRADREDVFLLGEAYFPGSIQQPHTGSG